MELTGKSLSPVTTMLPLSLLEEKFSLAPLTNRDGASNTMLDCFDFSQTPLPPVIIPVPTVER
jgi:hypothetical protein